MKRILIGCLLGSVLFLGAAASQAQKSDATAKAVERLEHQWMKSQQTNDPAPLDTLLADSFVGTSEAGKVENKAETIAEAKSTKYIDTWVKMPSGKWQCVASHVSNVAK